jgi:hypothetical protein
MGTPLSDEEPFGLVHAEPVQRPSTLQPNLQPAARPYFPGRSASGIDPDQLPTSDRIQYFDDGLTTINATFKPAP